ncbi:MAG: TerB family tellurite resistance protein [Prevotella sp.]
MDEKLKSRFLGLYCMILADGVIDSRELETVYRIGRETYGLTEDEILTAIRDSGTSYELPVIINEKIELLYQLGEIAWADGRIEESEKDIMRKYALQMDFDSANIDAIVDYILDKVEHKVPLSEVIKEVND